MEIDLDKHVRELYLGKHKIVEVVIEYNAKEGLTVKELIKKYPDAYPPDSFTSEADRRKCIATDTICTEIITLEDGQEYSVHASSFAILLEWSYGLDEPPEENKVYKH